MQSTSSSNEMFLCSPLHWLVDGDVEMWGNSAVTQPGPHTIICLGWPRPHWNESFPLLHCSLTPGSLQRSYLCNKVIKGSVITRPSLSTFSLFTSPILSSVPTSPPPLLLQSLFHHPQTFSLSFIIQILLLTLVDPKHSFDVLMCVYWQEERWNKVECLLFKGDISMIRVLEINPPSLYLRDCRVLCACERERERSPIYTAS